MFSSVVSPVINRIVEICASLIKEGEFPFFSGYKDDLEKLSGSLITIQATMDDAEETQFEEDDTLKDWLSRLKEVAYDAEHVLDTISTEASAFHHMIAGAGISHITPNLLRDISRRIEKIAKEKQRLNLLLNGGYQLRGSLDTSYLGDTGLFGREREIDEIVDLLVSENSERFEKNVAVVGINGAGGVGKTTVAHLIFNDERVQRCFQSHRIWVSLAQGCSLPGILQGIRGFPSNISCAESQYPCLETAFKEFLCGQRFLIVLDNLSFKNHEDQIRLLQLLEESERKGSQLLYTSRNPIEIDGESSFLLQPLSMENSWCLFKTIGFQEGILPNYLEEIGKSIVHKCQGSPLSVKLLGSLLRGNTDLEDWKRIHGSNLPALKICYYNLPSHLKECFLSCSSFPKDYVFDKQDLAKMWMAQGFIPLEGEDDAEEIGFTYFEELLRRCFFQPFKIGNDNGIQYTIHDVIYGFAQSNSPFPKNRHILEKLDPHPYEDQLFFQRNATELKFIRVLDLSWSQIYSLPNSIEECKLLRYLDLSMSAVFGLPDSICNLHNLQTLKLLGCIWLEELPRDLSKLLKLRHLEMDNKLWRCFFLWPPKLGKLTSLRTLSVYPVGHGSGCGIEELKGMEFLTGSLHISCLENAVNAKEANLNGKKRLRKLVLEWSDTDRNPQDEESHERVLEDLLPNENILELEIVNYIGIDFPILMRNGLLQNLVALTLTKCIRCKILALDLPSLRKLCIKGLQKLEELMNLQCPVLNELQIIDCHLTHSLPKNGLPASLLLLRIHNCPRLSEQCKKEIGPEWPKIAHISNLQICATQHKKPSLALLSMSC